MPPNVSEVHGKRYYRNGVAYCSVCQSCGLSHRAKMHRGHPKLPSGSCICGEAKANNVSFHIGSILEFRADPLGTAVRLGLQLRNGDIDSRTSTAPGRYFLPSHLVPASDCLQAAQYHRGRFLIPARGKMLQHPPPDRIPAKPPKQGRFLVSTRKVPPPARPRTPEQDSFELSISSNSSSHTETTPERIGESSSPTETTTELISEQSSPTESSTEYVSDLIIFSRSRSQRQPPLFIQLTNTQLRRVPVG